MTAFLSITDQLDHVCGGQSAGDQAAALENLRNLGYPIKDAMVLDAKDPKFGPQVHARCISARVINPAAPDRLYCLPDPPQ